MASHSEGGLRVLVVGGGGREHALAWRASQAPRVGTVFLAPGNAGSAHEPGLVNTGIGAKDLDGLLAFAHEERIGLTIVGPEDPLAAGIVDRFLAAGLPCFGPSAAAARLESSKAFAKDFMARHGIPTAAYGQFTDLAAAEDFIRERGAPIVIKADGLAAGKGVVVAQDEAEALAAVRTMLAGNAFGEAGHRVVIEEFLAGEEASFIVMAAGTQVLPLATSQDHKAAGDGDTGPNTGGMGAYSPAPVLDRNLHRRVMEEVIEPTLEGMAAEGHPFTGFLYAGLMIGPEGAPRVLEYNVRFGDPETQPVMLRLRSDLTALCQAALEGRLDQCTADWDPRASLGVVMAAGGYPGPYAKGAPIEGLDRDFGPDVKIFHAGTAMDDSGRVVTAGGRVLCVTALGEDVRSAQEAAYAACEKIHWEGAFHRHDIGYRAIARETAGQRAGQAGKTIANRVTAGNPDRD